MVIKLVCVGTLKEKYWKEAIDEYSKRLSKFAKLSIVEVDEYKINDDNESLVLKEQIEEGKNILSKIKKDEYVILLDRLGSEIDSISLSKKLESISLTNSNITFIIGGSYGVSNDVSKRADYKLAFSKLTFPHQLFRVMLLEQIYRAYKILNNEKYHK